MPVSELEALNRIFFMHLPNTLQNCTDHVATVEKGESDEEQVEGVTQVAAGQNHTEDYVSC